MKENVVDDLSEFRKKIVRARIHNKKVRSNDPEYWSWQALVPSKPPRDQLTLDFSSDDLCEDAAAYHQ